MIHAACKCLGNPADVDFCLQQNGFGRLMGFGKIICQNCGRSGPRVKGAEAAWADWDLDHSPDPRLEQALDAMEAIEDKHPLALEYEEDARYVWPARWEEMLFALAAIGGAKEEK